MADLTGVKLKISRARDHLDSIGDEVAGFVASNPYRVVAEFDPQNIGYGPTPEAGYVVRLQQTAPLHANHLSLLVGDCVHNLRSALDHLAWQLVLASGGTPTEWTQFPIHKSATTKAGKPMVVRIEGGVDTAALTIIEQVQPYHAGKDADLHPLAIVHDLDRFDKHRVLQPVAHSIVCTKLGVTDPEGGSWASVEDGTFEHGAPLVVFPIRRDHGPLDVDGELTALVALDNVPSGIAKEPVTDLLDRLIGYVQTDVIQPLATFI